MNFSVKHGPVFTVLEIKLSQGESIKAEAGAMVSMSSNLELKAKTTGKGFLGAIGAMVGGESLFASVYTATAGDAELVLAPAAPGDVVSLDLNSKTILAQAGAFLAGDPGLEITTQGSFKAMFSGEGLFLSKITGTGKLFLNSYGAVYEKTLAAGETYVVDTGHIVAFEASVNYKLRKAAKGLFSTLASGEGLVCDYTGPGKLWIQTRNLPALAAMIAKFLPKTH